MRVGYTPPPKRPPTPDLTVERDPEHRSVRTPEHRTTFLQVQAEPVSFMDQPVVRAAQKEQVRYSCHPSVCPMNDVVGITPVMGSATPREPAGSVTNDHRPADRRWHHSGASSHVQGLRASCHHHPHHRGITPQTPSHLSTHRPGVIELTESTLQLLHIHAQGDVGTLPTDQGPIASIEPLAADLTQGIGPSLSRGPLVLDRPRSDLGVHDGTEC